MDQSSVGLKLLGRVNIDKAQLILIPFGRGLKSFQTHGGYLENLECSHDKGKWVGGYSLAMAIWLSQMAHSPLISTKRGSHYLWQLLVTSSVHKMEDLQATLVNTWPINTSFEDLGWVPTPIKPGAYQHTNFLAKFAYLLHSTCTKFLVLFYLGPTPFPFPCNRQLRYPLMEFD